MLFKKKAVKFVSARQTPTVSLPRAHKLPDSIRRELIRLAWLGLAGVLLLSLVSYSPSDPSWSTWSSKRDFANWMGRGGSVAADLFFQFFGLSSFVLVFLLVALAFRNSDDEKGSPVISPALFLVALSSFLQCLFPASWMPWHLRQPGGVVGKSLADGLNYGLGHVGATLISGLAVVATIIVVFRFELLAWAGKVTKQLVPFLKTAIPALFASLRTAIESIFEKLPERTELPPEIPIAVPQVSPSILPAPVEAKKPEPEKRDGDDDDEMISTRAEEDEELFRMLAPKAQKAPKPVEVKRAPKGTFQLPPLNFLSGKAESKVKSVDRNWYLEKGNILVQKLKDFGVEGEVVHISPGPVITVYEFKPASGVKIKEISNLSDDLTLALSVLSVRIVAPIPGKPVVGIEIPSPHREMVHFKDLIEETPFYTGEIRIPIVLGRLASGEPVVAGLATMPHLLVAGSTGTGKSVFINSLICSLLYRYTPDQLKLILVDPKMVELSSYEDIPHLLLPVVVDSKKAAMALRWTVEEMEKRYSLMHEFGVRHLDAYNERVDQMRMNGQKGEDGEEHQNLPYIVVVIDEYADLMAVVPKDVELSIARLAQKARASGIHLVLATQRPSTDVVTGTIKANFPSRISFRVASAVDSKTILDRTGADRLLGNGDMLFHSAGFMSLKRMQGAFLSDADIERVVNFLKEQGEPEYDDSILAAQELDPTTGELPGLESDGGEAGQLYDQAVRLVSEKGEASISLIQRHLKIGYNRAATLMEQMEKEGVVAPAAGASKRRAVLINSL